MSGEVKRMPSRKARRINHNDIERMGEFKTLYVIQCDRYYKVGITTDAERRMEAVLMLNPMDVRYAMRRSVLRQHAGFAERTAHALLNDYHHRGEWFEAPFEAVKKAVDLALSRARAREWDYRAKLHRVLEAAE